MPPVDTANHGFSIMITGDRTFATKLTASRGKYTKWGADSPDESRSDSYPSCHFFTLLFQIAGFFSSFTSYYY